MERTVTRKLAKKIDHLKKAYNVSAIFLFGSSLIPRKKTPPTDIDLLVEFSKTPSLFEFVALKNELELILGRKVDLVTKEALRPWMKASIEMSMKRVA